jgi:hypothetical protein
MKWRKNKINEITRKEERRHGKRERINGRNGDVN